MSSSVPESLRQDYHGERLDVETAPQDPYELFARWFADALRRQIPQANAMVLSTVDQNQRPHARIVLMKDMTPEGFSFFTNYESNKGQQLNDNKAASLLFWWEPLGRQIRIEGIVEKLSAQESDAYFNSRPEESNLGAIASQQSRPIESRAALEHRVEEARKLPRPLVRPVHWGGYRLVPDAFEFWQGQPSRLHDRVFYTREESLFATAIPASSWKWKRIRLMP